MQVLETERLILRHYRLEDLDAMVELYSQPEFVRFVGSPGSREEILAGIRAFIEEYKTMGYGFYTTLLKPDLQFIGRCGLLTQIFPDGVKEIEVAYGIAPAYWGQGYATEAARALKQYAFEQLGFSRVISIVDTQNVASQRVAEKNGMHIERTFRNHGHDCFLYAVERQGELD